MTQSLSNLGEMDRSQLQTFADVIRRASDRADNRSALAEETGLSEQNLRRWSDQGEWPGLEKLYTTRRDWPLPMLIDFLSWFATGTRVRLHIEPIGDAPATGSLSACCRKVTDQAIQLERYVDEAERDGSIDSAEGSNIRQLTADQMVNLQQLAHSVFVGTSRRRA